MDLLEAMRSTFSCRDFTDEPVPDDAIFRMLDAARFAPSGGNRQGWRVLVMRDRAVRERMAELVKPVMRRYVAETLAGEAPFNALTPSRVDDATVARTPLPDATWRPLIDAPVAAALPLGRPKRVLTRLRRNAVESFARLERWDGEPLRAAAPSESMG